MDEKWVKNKWKIAIQPSLYLVMIHRLMGLVIEVF